MPKGPATTTADEITDNIRALIDRVADAKLTQEMARRGQDVAGLLSERGTEVGAMAGQAWRDTRPQRRDAAKRLSRATGDAAKWSDRTWQRSLRPMLRDLWSRRTVALGAAGVAVPAGRELVDTAAVRLRLKEREDRHWGAFFLGLLLGAVGGAIVALLTTPKRGSEMRHELSVKADEVRNELSEKARDAEWVPIFQRDQNGHGTDAADALEDATDNLHEAATEAGAASGETADQAAADTAEAINETYDSVDRESPA